MFNRVNFSSHFTLIRVIFIVLILTSVSGLFAQEQNENQGNQWYICEIKSKQKANDKKYFGPYASKETALANWIYRDLQENKKYCIALRLTYMTSTPSSYFGREWKAVKEDYNFDREYFIKKYSIELDEKVEAAYLKSQGKKPQKAEKSVDEKTDKKKKSDKKETEEIKEKSNKKDKASQKKTAEKKEAKSEKDEKIITPDVDTSKLSEVKKANENAKLAKLKAKEDLKTASENAALTVEKVKETRVTKVEADNQDIIQNAQETVSDSKENLNNAKEASSEEKGKNKETLKLANETAKHYQDVDLYTLPQTLDSFYKKEKRDSLAKQIKKEAEDAKKEIEVVKEEPVVPPVEETKVEVEVEIQPVNTIPEEYKDIEAIKPETILVIEEEKTEVEDKNIKTEPVPFKFTSTQSNVSRYKKEYLQDYIPQEKYVPQNENNIKQHIDNPNETDSKGQTLLMKAAKSGNDWQIKTLLNSGANVNLKDNDGWTALMYACRYQESISTLKTLIEAGAKVKEKNNYDSSALILAANYNDNPEILSYLLKYYSNSEKEVLKCFILLLSSNQPSEYLQLAKVNIFMDKAIPLNTFYQGKTPLMYAAQYGNSTKTLKLLLDNDALTTIRSSEGKTAFDYAAKNSNLAHDENYWALNKK